VSFMRRWGEWLDDPPLKKGFEAINAWRAQFT
jgi:hypothetical protein